MKCEASIVFKFDIFTHPSSRDESESFLFFAFAFGRDTEEGSVGRFAS